MRRIVCSLALGLVVLSSACATVESSLRVTGSPRSPSSRPVPVFYAVAPPFRYREVAHIDAVGRNAEAHLDDLLDEAERRARQVGADAIVIRDVRTEARPVIQRVLQTCTSVGPGGVPLQYNCPAIIHGLYVETHLDALAVHRDDSAPDAHVWPLPPPLGALGRGEGSLPAAPPPTLPDLDEVLTPP